MASRLCAIPTPHLAVNYSNFSMPYPGLILQIVEKIRHSIENKMYGCGIIINLKKAFDTVNHTIILYKLE